MRAALREIELADYRVVQPSGSRIQRRLDCIAFNSVSRTTHRSHWTSELGYLHHQSVPDKYLPPRAQLLTTCETGRCTVQYGLNGDRPRISELVLSALQATASDPAAQTATRTRDEGP